jgi:hypothetical protein
MTIRATKSCCSAVYEDRTKRRRSRPRHDDDDIYINARSATEPTTEAPALDLPLLQRIIGAIEHQHVANALQLD